MILSEHALKGNGNKLVQEFFSTLESVTSWLDIVNEVGIRELDPSARDSSIFSVTQPVSYSYTCHVICKVKYFGKVANV